MLLRLYLLLSLGLLLPAGYINAQAVDSTVKTELTPAQKAKRQWLIGGLNVAAYGGSLVVLNAAWYANEPRSPIHAYDDSREWLQMDKIGHAWTAYNAGRASTALWEWAGVPHKKAVWIGGLSGAGYLTVIEFLDSRSAKWGWSWSDMAANVLGSGAFMSQELLWGEQRIQYKFSFHRKKYPAGILNDRADDLYGNAWYERMLKDYNAQAYWFSANVKSFFPDSNWPSWLNIAVGYGADGMFGGYSNKWTDETTGISYDRSDIPRKRQFYLAPDIDLTKIPTRSRFLKTAFSVFNSFKFPAPALMIDNKGKFKAYGVYF